jgi:hypothetical protein
LHGCADLPPTMCQTLRHNLCEIRQIFKKGNFQFSLSKILNPKTLENILSSKYFQLFASITAWQIYHANAALVKTVETNILILVRSNSKESLDGLNLGMSALRGKLSSQA